MLLVDNWRNGGMVVLMSNEHPAAFARESACEVAADASADLDAARLLAELPAPAQPGDERAAASAALLLATAAVVGAERSGGLWVAVAAEACHAAGQANRAFAVARVAVAS